jgi:magnesium transporter
MVGRPRRTGSNPGELVYARERRAEPVKITVIDYDEVAYDEREVKSPEECLPFKDKKTTTWINIDGLHEINIIKKISEDFDIHPLVLEDILNTDQRPKLEDYEGYIFIVLKMLQYHKTKRQITTEQVSLVLGSNFIISFQEEKGDVFEPIRKRIRENKGRVRKMKADYLAYLLIDSLIDNYFLMLETFGDKIENIEEELIENPTSKTVHVIHNLKKNLITLRKSVWPLREVIGAFQRLESPIIRKATNIYLRDIYNHTIQVIDTVETFRDMVSGMLDIYLTSINNRMNEIMKVLTIIATIFIPATFIAGVYGMNFKYMPELDWKLGYLFAWGIVTIIGISMLIYFKKRNWI